MPRSAAAFENHDIAGSFAQTSECGASFNLLFAFCVVKITQNSSVSEACHHVQLVLRENTGLSPSKGLARFPSDQGRYRTRTAGAGSMLARQSPCSP